ncbi:metallophosphoesterase [Jeotgalibaca sp. A122]|uniref:metallophosphoesterase n=1 Tax=Jeotgalibaca sp. A122 TaxID=3457322 RepID=UPI003FD18017
MIKKLAILSALIISGGFLYRFTAAGTTETEFRNIDPLVSESEDLKIWMVTDIHYISPELHDVGSAFAQMKASAAGKDLAHIDSVMQALVWEAAIEKPDLLIVSGDLTFNGEYQSMVDLAAYFEQVEANGTQVSVIPGNHDIHSGWARKFEGPEMKPTKQVSPDDFRELFADFGFDLAINQDPNSLSYAIEPATGYPILMMDTNIYTDTENTSSPTVEGKIKMETAAWLSDYFQVHNAKMWVGHHPLLSHNDSKRTGHTLVNADEINPLLKEQGITALFAGHIHAQNISSDADTREVITGALSIFPNSVGEITISPEGLNYSHRELAVEEWAQATNQTDPDLLDYKQTAYDIFYEDGATLGLRQMFEEQWYEETYEEDVMDFVGRLNVRYFSGQDFETDETLETHPGYKIIQENSDGFLKRYSTRSLQDIDLDDRNLFIPNDFLVK